MDNQEITTHLRHCYQGEYEDGCKYGNDKTCPATITPPAGQFDMESAKDIMRGAFLPDGEGNNTATSWVMVLDELGIYPASVVTPDGITVERTPEQTGWNNALIAATKGMIKIVKESSPPPAGQVEAVAENELSLSFTKVFNDGVMAGAAKENPKIYETYKLEFIRTRNEILTKFKASGAEHIAGRQPIETAPKDGTWILLFDGNTNEEFDEFTNDVLRPVTGKWDDDREKWVIGYYDGAWFNHVNNPTHWASIPPELRVASQSKIDSDQSNCETI